ncbi:hypothetical protein [Acidovorax sp. NO-1]|uniref:ABC transporter ATP-binding protein C-terminal domain-containing protein n=1 Tax=Acidovorax sp. NO-1 TaxID=512030 RepID=UPI00350F7BD7
MLAATVATPRPPRSRRSGVSATQTYPCRHWILRPTALSEQKAGWWRICSRPRRCRNQGQKLAEGAPAAVRANAAVQAVYFGEAHGCWN